MARLNPSTACKRAASAGLPLGMALLLCLALTPGAMAQGNDAENARRAAESVLDDDRFQRELPSGQTDRLPPPVAVDRDSVRRAANDVLENGRIQREIPAGRPYVPPARTRITWFDWLPEGLGGVARALMWIVIVVVGVLVLGYLAREVIGFNRRSRARAEANGAATKTGGGIEKDAVEATLAEADRLSQAGRFGEAIHVLLMCCLGELRRRRRDAQLAPSLTSREILARLSLPERAAAAFAAIVGAVELSHFGGRPADAGQYQARRDDFLRFADESGSGA